MARDGLLPTGFFGAVHDRFRTPWKATILTGIFVATLAALVPLRILADLVNIGTLLAFVMVCSAVLIMRRTNPDAPRPFRARGVGVGARSEEHTSELQSLTNLVCRLLLEKKKKKK